MHITKYLGKFLMVALVPILSIHVQARPNIINQDLTQPQYPLDPGANNLIPPQSLGPLDGGPNDPVPRQSFADAKPFYAIAHRVLMSYGARSAVSHGANALEIDMYAWKKGWWADHDGSPSSSGDTAEKMFQTIAELRGEGMTINFVWLDIKNPDWCDPEDNTWKHCSIDALRDLARKYLEPVGVRILYGFYGATVSGKAYKRILSGLKGSEGLNINGKAADVAKAFQDYGSPNKARRIMSYGYFNLPFQFGDCHEESFYTCTELRQGTESRNYGQVYGWTLATGQIWQADKLIGTAGVDGIIYGFKQTHYYDHEHTRNGIKLIRALLEKHSGERYLARQEDQPW
ncbi:Phospholipase D [Fusarium fujikuroi]|nr:Phospholipase D [Fusarium fujikuroi]